MAHSCFKYPFLMLRIHSIVLVLVHRVLQKLSLSPQSSSHLLQYKGNSWAPVQGELLPPLFAHIKLILLSVSLSLQEILFLDHLHIHLFRERHSLLPYSNTFPFQDSLYLSAISPTLIGHKFKKTRIICLVCCNF